MTRVTRAPSHDRLAAMADDVRQLVLPIHVAQHRRLVTHPALLDQLREACVPGNSTRGPERRRIPDSRPPLRLEAVDALSEVYAGISFWRVKLDLPSPPRNFDWQKAILRALVGAAPTIAPSIADWLAADVEDWWRGAAVGSGWRPDDLRRLR